MASQPVVRAEFIPKLRPLFQPHRYKALRGGRGALKSWSVARALLILGTMQPRRILCAREFQSSIRDSVHRLLSDQIGLLQLAGYYRIEKQGIYGANGTEIAFVGLSDQTADSVKSFEGFDICWVEEAQVVSERSWQILLPTIRKEGSEVWVTFNPELDSDPTWRRFVANKPTDCFEVELNWRDNPWFTGPLRAEREHDERLLPKFEYEWIWEGKCKPSVSGAIYADEIAAMAEQRRYGEFPYDPFHLAYPVFDLGWNDSMVIGIWQRNVSQLRLVDYIEDDHRTLDWYSRLLREKPYNYGKCFIPHDGDHGDYRSDQGRSARQILEGLGWRVEVLPQRGIEEGIRETRMQLGSVFVNRALCADWYEHMRRYRRSIPRTTGEAAGAVHDEHSHAADMTRYAVRAAAQMDDDTGMNLPELKYGATGIV